MSEESSKRDVPGRAGGRASRPEDVPERGKGPAAGGFGTAHGERAGHAAAAVHVDADPLVAALVPDPCAPANVWTARGFPGRHCVDTHLRLYLALELDEWLEIPKAAVRHVVQCDAGCAGLGGVVLWIDRSAKVQHTRSRQVEAPTGTFRSSPRSDWAGHEDDWEGADPGQSSKYCG